MKFLLIVVLLLSILGLAPLCAQQKDKEQNISTPSNTTPSDSTLHNKSKNTRQNVKSDITSVKSSFKVQADTLTPDSTRRIELKKVSQQHHRNLLEQKTSNLQYNSDDPDSAPWKNNPLGKEEVKNLLPAASPKAGAPSIDNKANAYKNLVTDIKPSAASEQQVRDKVTSQSGATRRIERTQHAADSLLTLNERAASTDVASEFTGAKKVHSEKYKRKLYDSLGTCKADSILQVATALAKTETPKEELLNRVNAPIKDKAGKAGVGIDEKNQSLKVADADKLNGIDKLSKNDLSSLQLLADVLSELPPLSGQLTDSEYMPVIDSMRNVAMKAKGYSLDEDEVTDEMKTAAYKEKPRFIDRSYFEGILTFVNDSTFSIVQVSPAWAYHFTPYLSAGLGPNLSIQYEKDRINALVGFRTFVKTEFWKQRAYVQVEDNVDQQQADRDAVRKAVHSILVGGGALLPISKKIAINAAIFYQVNQHDVKPGGSSWVFRIGLSSVKKQVKNK